MPLKGRDWYDFEWYVRHNIPLDFTHLHERAIEFNNEDITKDSFLEKLNERLATADINQVKADVLPFIRNPKEMGPFFLLSSQDRKTHFSGEMLASFK